MIYNFRALARMRRFACDNCGAHFYSYADMPDCHQCGSHFGVVREGVKEVPSASSPILLPAAA